MLREVAYSLECCTGPSRLKSSFAHIIGTGDYRRRKQERIFKPDSADISRDINIIQFDIRQTFLIFIHTQAKLPDSNRHFFL